MPKQYLEFKITSPEYSKNSKKRGWLALEMSLPFKFVSFSTEPSLALVSPIRNTFPRAANSENLLVKTSKIVYGRGGGDGNRGHKKNKNTKTQKLF